MSRILIGTKYLGITDLNDGSGKTKSGNHVIKLTESLMKLYSVSVSGILSKKHVTVPPAFFCLI